MSWWQILGALGLGAVLTKLLDILWLNRVTQENDRQKWLRDQRLAAYADVAKDFLSFRLGSDKQHENPFEAYAVASRAILLVHDNALAARIDRFIVRLDRYFNELQGKEDEQSQKEAEQLYNELNDEARNIIGDLRTALVNPDASGVQPMHSMRRSVVLAAVCGAVFAAIVLAGSGLWSYWNNRPKAWDRNAVTATFDSVDAEGSERNLVFYYILSNNTDRDFRIDSDTDVRLAGRLQRQAALTAENSKEFLATEFPVFIPAKQRSRFAVHLGYPYEGATPLTQGTSPAEREQNEKSVLAYVRNELTNLDGFVVFHEPTRYQVDLPSGWRDK